MKTWTTKRTQLALLVVVIISSAGGLMWFLWPSLATARERLPTVSGKRLTELLSVSAWPLLVLVALFLFRSELRSFAAAIGSRASKVSILSLEIELAQSAQLTGWPAPAIQGVKEADGAVVAQDSSMSLFQELHGTTADFAVVNLGRGKEWLTSRIYILATLLRRMRAIRAIVFLTDSPAHERVFLGVVSPDDLRTRFDFYYPWLGECLLTQYKTMRRPPMGPPPEKLDVFEAQRLLGFYIEDLRKKKEDAVEEEWTELRPEVFEHARWVDGATLLRVLGSHLERSSILWKPTLGKDEAREILAKQGDFVALVDGEGVFKDTLIDRRFMLESLAREIAAHE